MSNIQLVQPNLNIVGTVGNCLMYAHEMFGAPGGVTWAWQAWENAKYKHADSNLPTGVSVPMWYQYRNGEGHVTVNVVGRGIYSSPYALNTTHAVLGSIADVERIYGVQYVGWSEDINGVRVAEIVPLPSPTPAPNTDLIMHKGTATVTESVPLNVRTSPSTNGLIVAQYVNGQSFNYDSYIITGGYVWLSYISVSGVRHYIAEGPDDGNEANVWVKGGI